ncbi:MAG: leucine-rich repeat domain-containing protein [Ruminococcus sp.]|nr:leucine-rich repeat domain-containing protein [Ruminococcus sp.]
MKKLLSSLLAVCLCLTSAAALGSCGCQKEDTRVITAETTQPELVDENGFGYVIVDGKTLTLTQYKGSAVDIQVPSEYDGKPVTEIENSVFRSQDIKSVSIPSSIKKIGNRAFSDCQKLEKVELAEGVEYIDTFAFSYAFALKEIKLPSTLKTIGQYAFTACAMEEVKIPEGVEEIGAFAFYQCENLKTAYVPDTVTTIDKGAFKESAGLTIYGKSGSAAEQYANDNGDTFAEE